MTNPNDIAAELERLRRALEELKDALECGPPENDRTHYCPNCDNSLHGAYEIARRALGSAKE